MNNTIHNSGEAFEGKIQDILQDEEEANAVLAYIETIFIPELLNEENRFNKNELEGVTFEDIQTWSGNITEEQAKQIENELKNYIQQRYSSVQGGGKKHRKPKKTRKQKRRGKKTRKH